MSSKQLHLNQRFKPFFCSFTEHQVQVYMARLTSMELEKKYDALTEERASEVLELCDFVLDKIKVGRKIYEISKYNTIRFGY